MNGRRMTGEQIVIGELAERFSCWAIGIITIGLLALTGMVIRHEVSIAKVQTQQQVDSAVLKEVHDDVKAILRHHQGGG